MGIKAEVDTSSQEMANVVAISSDQLNVEEDRVYQPDAIGESATISAAK